MNEPPLGWSVDSTMRHGSADSRNSSRPTDHCSAATAAVSVLVYGTMPHRVSSSMSTLTHLRPLLFASRYSTGPSAVSVVAGPHITGLTSPVTSGCVLMYSISSRAPDDQPPSGVVA